MYPILSCLLGNCSSLQTSEAKRKKTEYSTSLLHLNLHTTDSDIILLATPPPKPASRLLLLFSCF